MSLIFILVKSIKKLESFNLSLFNATEIVDETISNVEMVPENYGFKILKKIIDVSSGKEESVLPPKLTPVISSCLKFAPITS